MEELVSLDQEMLKTLTTIASDGIENAANGFSTMIGRQIQSSKPMASLVPILKIPNFIGGPDDDAVGVYLRFQGDLAGQIMIIIPHPKSFELVDLLMGQPLGTTQTLGTLEKSALGELGNLCTSFFLNSLASSIHASFRPTPPAVMVDLVGAILDVVVATTGGISEHILLMHANFLDGPSSVEADFWIIPDTKALQELIKHKSRV